MVAQLLQALQTFTAVPQAELHKVKTLSHPAQFEKDSFVVRAGWVSPIFVRRYPLRNLRDTQYGAFVTHTPNNTFEQ